MIVKEGLIIPGLVSDIPAGDGKIANLFLQCRMAVSIPWNRFLGSLKVY